MYLLTDKSYEKDLDRVPDLIDNELRTYLKENIVNYKKDFSMLGWWRVNVIRFPTVAEIEKGDYFFLVLHSFFIN